MSKIRFVGAVAAKTEQSKQAVQETISVFLDEVTSTLAKRQKVTLGGFGTFRVQQRKARKGRNPQTGEPITIPAAWVVRFKPGVGLRSAVK